MVLLSNCRKETFLSDSSAKVDFSKDTIIFDTVFTTIGSTYERFTVHNPYNDNIMLSNIRLGKGTGSAFRINVDGVPGTNINNIEIPSKDSVYVFVEVTVDPTNANAPFVIEDDIFFTVNGNIQNVHLVAWGQNAYFHFNEEVGGETWNNDKPHVLYGITAVGFPEIDSGKTLTIPAGTRIYAHADAVLYVYKSKLEIKGTVNDKVIFQGDRREASFSDEPGQWFGIRFAVAQNSLIEHTVIKNGTVGIYADTAFGGSASSDSIKLNSVESYNHSYASVLAQGAHIYAENCMFGSSGINSVALRLGGNYYFNHCTIGNYWTKSTRTTPALILNNYYQSGLRPFDKATFHNSIIYGSNDNELTLDTVPGHPQIYTFNHCIIKTDQAVTNGHYTNIKKNVDPLFTSFTRMKIPRNSQATNSSDTNYPLRFDIDGNSRDLSGPDDIGCFEAQ